MMGFLRAILEGTFLGMLQGQIMRRPMVAGIVGLVFAGLFANLTIVSYKESQRLPSEPARLTTAEAAAVAPEGYDNRPWVVLDDAVIDCHNIHYERVGSDYRTSVVLTDPLETIIVVATYSNPKRLSCVELAGMSASGMLSHMNARRYARFQELGEFDLSGYESATAYMDLCAFCGGGNSSLGVYIGLLMTLLSLSLYPLLLWARRRQAAVQ